MTEAYLIRPNKTLHQTAAAIQFFCSSTSHKRPPWMNWVGPSSRQRRGTAPIPLRGQISRLLWELNRSE